MRKFIWAIIITIFSLFTLPVFARDGGPDQFGYFWTDTIPPLAPDAPSYQWEDDFLSGTLLNLQDDDYSIVPIGFNFTFYGVTYTTVAIASNGFIRFSDSIDFPDFTGAVPEEYCASDPTCVSGKDMDGDGPLTKDTDCSQGYCILKVPLPDRRYPAMVAAYLTDLNPSISFGGIYYEKRTTSTGDQYLLITYSNIADANGAFPVSFQIKLYEKTNQIIVVYKNVPSNGNWHVAGIQDPTGSSGVAFDFSNWSIVTTAVRYVFPPLPPAYGLYVNDEANSAQYGEPGENVKLKSYWPAFSAVFDSTDLSDEAYWLKIQVATTDTFNTGTIIWDTGAQYMATGDPPAGIHVGVRTPDVLYSGPALESGKKYYWRVTFWDKVRVRTVTPYKSKNSFCVITCEKPLPGISEGGGEGTSCFISSAVYSPHSKETITFKWLRDNYLAKSRWGRNFIRFYYEYSPYVANEINKSEILKFGLRLFIYPLYLVTKFFLFVPYSIRFTISMILLFCILWLIILKPPRLRFGWLK